MSIFASAPTQFPGGAYIDTTRWNTEVYTKMTEINALFNYASGHDHSGADKGKQISVNKLAVMTAHFDAGDYQIRASRFRSDVPTGTAPFIISSTTKVTNLNVDLLDGLDSNKFLRHAAGTVNVKIQGGSANVHWADGIGTIVFPTAFSTNCLAAVVAPNDDLLADAGRNVSIYNKSKTSLALRLRESNGALSDGSPIRYVHWIAIGY
ncbi:hypothetical protein ES705_11211 [subsurface metagenome]